MINLPEIKISSEVRLESRRTAVLIIDMQNDFVHERGSLRVTSALGTVGKIRKLIDKARKNNVKIIYTKDTHFEGDPEFEIWGDHAKRGSWGWEIFDELAPHGDDIVIEKSRYDAFYGTPLDDYLRTRGITNLVVVGTVANICVLYTVASASMRWYKVIVPIDGLSALDEFDLWAALRQIDFVHKGIIVKSVDDIQFV